MGKKTTIRWFEESEGHDFPAAASYLSLLFGEAEVKDIVKKLRKVPMTSFKAKEIFRASLLSLLGVSNFHVRRNLRKTRRASPCRRCSWCVRAMGEGDHRRQVPQDVLGLCPRRGCVHSVQVRRIREEGVADVPVAGTGFHLRGARFKPAGPPPRPDLPEPSKEERPRRRRRSVPTPPGPRRRAVRHGSMRVPTPPLPRFRR